MGEQNIQRNEECQSGHEGFKPSNLLKLGCEEAPNLNHPYEPLLQRIDHLDEILSTMEDKAPTERTSSPSGSPQPSSRCHSSAPTTPSSLAKRCRPTEFVLEEVQEKGTLVERISDLEKRVMTLQRLLPSKLNENPSGFPHRRAMSHQEMYDQQVQEPIDVDKHEVMTLSHSDPVEHKGHPEPFVDSMSHDPHSEKSESPHAKHHKDKVSSGKALDAAEEQDPRVPGQVSKKKRLKIKNWLSKRLHIHLPGTPAQDKHGCSTGHCWRPQVHPKNCWNVGKRDSHSTPYAQYGHMPSDDE